VSDGVPLVWRVLSSLPHLLVGLWLLWLVFVPVQLKRLLRRNPAAHQLSKSGELMSFREILAVGCLGGFILLTFITAFCSWITLKLNGVI
jgi:hypothetical protein